MASFFPRWVGPTALTLLAILGLSGCPDKKAKYPNCSSDKECKDGEKCRNNKCVQCGDESDCAPGERCNQGACELKEGACRSTADCSDGKVCKDNACVACQSDADCPADKICSDGACITRGTCKTDTDCADDEDCVEGKCQSANASNASSCTLEAVYFDFDRAAVSDEAKLVLEKDAECLKKEGTKTVSLVGRTDPRGTEEYNIALSESRAQVVGNFLSRLGIDPARFRYVPKGETEAAGSDEQTWGQDRRVDLQW